MRMFAEPVLQCPPALPLRQQWDKSENCSLVNFTQYNGVKNCRKHCFTLVTSSSLRVLALYRYCTVHVLASTNGTAQYQHHSFDIISAQLARPKHSLKPDQSAQKKPVDNGGERIILYILFYNGTSAIKTKLNNIVSYVESSVGAIHEILSADYR